MISYPGLLDLAKQLAAGLRANDAPSQIELRRAVSCAYYAMFHALARCCADTLIGSSEEDRVSDEWRQVYRSLSHGYVMTQCNRTQMMARFPEEIRNFGDHFIDMQIARHSAEYDPHPMFRQSVVEDMVTASAQRIEQFELVDVRHRRAFSAFALLPVRRD